MEAGRIPNQSSPQFANQSSAQYGYVQNPAGVNYATGNNLEAVQNLSHPGQNLSHLGQTLPNPGQNLPPLRQSGQNVPQQLGQNLKTVGQGLGQNVQPAGQIPPPPPLVRHGQISTSSLLAEEGKFNAVIEDHFRRSLSSFSSPNVSSRNVNTVPAHMGTSSMANNSIGATMGTSSMGNNSMGANIGTISMGNSSIGATMGTSSIGNNNIGANMGTSSMGNNSMGPNMGTSSMGNNNIGATMGTSSIPSQPNTRFGFPGQTNTPQYGHSWKGPAHSAMRHPGAMPRVQGDPLIRQALGHEYHISHLQQDKPNNYNINQGQAHFQGVGGQQYRFPGMSSNQMNGSSSVTGESMDPRFTNNPCRMPNNMAQNVSAAVRQPSQNFAPNFNNFAHMQRPQNFTTTTSQYSTSQSLPVPPQAHQNVPKMPMPGFQHQPGTIPAHSHVYNNNNPRQPQMNTNFGPYSQSQGQYGMGSLQGHMTQGQGQSGMVAGQGYASQGRNAYHGQQQPRGQDPFAQRQNLFPNQGQQRLNRTVSGGHNLPHTWNHEKLAGIVETISNLANLSENTDSESRRKLIQIKENCIKNGLLGPNESFPAFLARYAIREKNRILGQQPSQPTVLNPPLPAQNSVNATATVPSQSMKGPDNASAIHSAFAIPHSHELHDKLVLGRWYAEPSTLKGTGKLPTPEGSGTIDKKPGLPVNMETVTTPAEASTNQRAAVSQVTEPFVLKPTVCTEEVIEYKVADLLRCLPKSVKAQIAKNMESNNEQSISEPNKDLNQVTDTIPDKNKFIDMPLLTPTSIEQSAVEQSADEIPKGGEESANNSREETPSADEQFGKADSFLDINKRISDELVLDYQFGTQDMDPDIDFRNYLPQLHLPTDLPATPSPNIHIPELEDPSLTIDSNKDNELSMASNDDTIELPIHQLSEMEDSSYQSAGEKEVSEATGDLPEPTVEIDRDEEPVVIGKKRKHSSISDTNLGKPPVKRARGRGRGGQTSQSRGGQTRGRGGQTTRGRGGQSRGRGKSWALNLTPRNKNKQSKPTRGKKAGRPFKVGQGRGKRGRPQIATIATDDSSETNTEHERSESPSISGLDGQVIQKPQDLKTLMDNLPHDELEKTTVSLSTLKMMLAWTEAKANAGQDEDDEDSDTVSVNSDNPDAEYITEDMDTHDVISEENNKEHNQYEPPADGMNESNDEKVKGESKREKHESNDSGEEKQSVEMKSPVKVSVKENKSHAELNKNSNSDTMTENKILKQNKDAVKDVKVAADKTSVKIKGDESQVETEANSSISAEAVIKVPDSESKSSTQVYCVTETHKMTWVRYHGRTVTQLIMPDGNFFIMKEILRRCFRIQEPDKSHKFSKIGILKRNYLKIPDIELPSLFYDYVVKNLVERKVIKTIPDRFIIISEVDANRLFHHVCKDQYCGNSCVTPFFQSTPTSSVNQKESTSKESEMKSSSRKDRNLFDFIENETVSPKSSVKKAFIKRKRNSFQGSITICSDDEQFNGYDSDRTLPYVDGKPLSSEEIKNINSLAEKEKTVVTDLDGSKLVTEKSKSENISTKSQGIDSPTHTLDTETHTKISKDLTSVDISNTNEHLQENTRGESGKTSDEIDKGKSMETDTGTDTGSNSKGHYSVGPDDVIVIEEDDDDADFSFGDTSGKDSDVCQLTLDKMKKELGLLRDHFSANGERKEPVELVQVHNIDSTAAFGENVDKNKYAAVDMNKQLSAIDVRKFSDISGINDSCIKAIDSALQSDKTVDTSVGIDLTGDDDDNDSNKDVIIGDWIFPAPPRAYPEDGTKKLEEANETIQKLIEKANKAKKKEEFADVLDTVFKLTEPLKQWTDKLFDHYEEGLMFEAQRLKSLDQLQLNENPETITLDDGDD